jgi:hypothetical protein
MRPDVIKDDKQYAALVGLDWADREHAWVLQWSDTGVRERGRLEQTPEAVERWLSELMERLNGRRIAVAIEQKHGAVVWMLLKYECVEIYPIHPQAAGQFRQALHPSGSKSDPADGELLLDLLVHHRDRLHVLEQEDEPTRRLLMLVEQRRHWVDEKTRLTNRLSDRLKVYFPQVLKWFQGIDEPAVLDLLERWPSLGQLQKAQRKSWEALLRRHRRTEEEAVAWAEQVRSAVPAVKDAALLDCYRLEVTELVALIRQTQTSIAKFDVVIADVSQQHPCWKLVQSLPGAGPAMAPRLLAALGNGSAIRMRGRCSATQELHPLRLPAGGPASFNSVERVRNFYAKPFMSGHSIR